MKPPPLPLSPPVGAGCTAVGALVVATSEDSTGSVALGAPVCDDSPAEGVRITTGGGDNELVGRSGATEELDTSLAIEVIEAWTVDWVSVSDAAAEEDTGDVELVGSPGASTELTVSLATDVMDRSADVRLSVGIGASDAAGDEDTGREVSGATSEDIADEGYTVVYSVLVTRTVLTADGEEPSPVDSVACISELRDRAMELCGVAIGSTSDFAVQDDRGVDATVLLEPCVMVRKLEMVMVDVGSGVLVDACSGSGS